MHAPRPHIVFLSAATGEYGSLRAKMAGHLQRAGIHVEHQENPSLRPIGTTLYTVNSITCFVCAWQPNNLATRPTSG